MDTPTPPAAGCEPLTWVKATASSDNGACVELARRTERTLVRDSKDPEGPVLDFDTQTFSAFLNDVKAGRFAI